MRRGYTRSKNALFIHIEDPDNSRPGMSMSYCGNRLGRTYGPHEDIPAVCGRRLDCIKCKRLAS